MESFLATVKLVFLTSDDFLKLDKENDFVFYYMEFLYILLLI